MFEFGNIGGTMPPRHLETAKGPALDRVKIQLTAEYTIAMNERVLNWPIHIWQGSWHTPIYFAAFVLS